MGRLYVELLITMANIAAKEVRAMGEALGGSWETITFRRCKGLFIAFLPGAKAFAWRRSAPRIPPDFLYAALDTSAYAAFFTESRMKLIDSNKLNRKSGSILGNSQSSLRDLSSLSPLTQDCPGFPVRCPRHVCVCGFLHGKPHEAH
jgi:hypothetical protein